jgi:cystathionine gamma-lyase/cystathionine beta-lyase
MEFETIISHAGKKIDTTYGAMSMPIYQTSNFVFDDIGKTRAGYDYSRTSNPTRKVLEDTLAKLEGGHAGFAFGTGMAAITTAAHLLKSSDHVISGDDIYGGTYRLFQNVMKDHGIEFSFIRLNDRKTLEAAIRPNTKMIWFESPSNPLLNIVDIEMVASVAKKYKILSVMDNTFATPYFLKPIEFGIDMVMHSTTKYLNGHSDVVGGALITSADELSQRVQFYLNALGTCAAPFDCWLVIRGIATLSLRMKQHAENAQAIAEYLESHPSVSKVYYPGLKNHPGHDIASRQMKGYGGMVSFEVKGGENAAHNFLRRAELFALAESLGGVASLAEYPALMSHASMSAAARQQCGITEGLVRLSVGIENINDLIKDLDQALVKR